MGVGVWSRFFWNMRVRTIISLVLMLGLAFVLGCSATQNGKGATAQQSVFPWVKPKEPERAGKDNMESFIARERPTITR